MKLYGNDFSPNSNKVRFAANAMGINHEYQSIDLAGGEQRQEWFLKINPVGRIPVLIDEDYRIFESNAIIRYLALKTNAAAYPADIRKRCLVDQWLDFSSIHTGMAMSKIMFNTFIYKIVNVPKDENSLKEGQQFLTNYLKITEAQLAQTKYICGPELTLADYCILAVLDPCEVVGFDLSAYSRLVAWRKDLQAREFYRKVFPGTYTGFVNDVMKAKV